MEEIGKCLGERIVLTSKSEVSYAGIAIKILDVDGVEGLLVKIDEHSGFSIFCPKDFIKDLLIIPLPKEES